MSASTRKTYKSVLSGTADYNISFSDMETLLLDLGFVFRRQRGSHRMYYHDEIHEFMNIQEDGAKAKGYEVRQLRAIILKHGL